MKRASSLWSEEGPLLQGDRIVICEHFGCCYDEERLDLSCFVPSARIRNDWCVLQESTFKACFIKEISKDVICLKNGERCLQKCKVSFPQTQCVFLQVSVDRLLLCTGG